MVNAYTWTFLFLSIYNSLTALIFVVILTYSFIRKRTLGVLILGYTFLFSAAGEIMTMISFFLYSFSSISELAIALMSFFVLIIHSINGIYIYTFGTRHIIRDNDLIKGVFIAAFAFLSGFILSRGIYDIVAVIENPSLEPSFFIRTLLDAPNLIMYFPIFDGLAITLFILLNIIYLRIAINAIRLQRASDDPITKKGFMLVWISMIVWPLGFAFFIPFMFEQTESMPILSLVSFILKTIITNTFGYLLLYLAWIQPNWLKKYFRKKAWFVSIYTGKIPASTIPQATKDTLVLSSDTMKSKIVEIKEK